MDQPPPSPPSFPWIPFLIGAVAGGLVASSFGGVGGALLGWLGAVLLRQPWPHTVRWMAALLTWGGGWMLLWIGSGYVRAVTGILRGLAP
jgi:hypothetical protein